MTFTAQLPHRGLPVSPAQADCYRGLPVSTGRAGQPLPGFRPPVPAGLPRLLPAHGTLPAGLRAHLARHGPLPYRGGPGLLTGEVEAAGLTGRGGAAFPTYRKLLAITGYGRVPVVIGNGAEGEPASSKDKALLRLAPHLVLDGLQLAAETVGTRSVGLYVHRNPRLHERLRAAIADRAAGRIDRARVELVEAPPRFLAGEESALASRTTGGPALPRYKPPCASQRGVAGEPTLVQNVETLAHLALIARYGAGWFRLAGTADEPGSMLATVHRADGQTDVLEVPLGIPLAELLGLQAHPDPAAAGGDRDGGLPGGNRDRGLPGGYRDGELPGGYRDGRLAGSPGAPDGQEGTVFSPAVDVQAVLVGGYHGAWLPATAALRLPLANAALRPLGAAVGAGVVAALPAGRCGIAETARVIRYLALESAGQCGPCFNGLPRMAAALADLAGPRPGPRVRADLERWAGLVEGRGACHHPDGTTRFIRSALGVFSAEIARHERGECAGAVRRPFLPLPGEPPLDHTDWR